MKKVLLISYYWPPAGGGGVQRWLKMSKYLINEGIDLTVYTPENPEYPAVDESSIKKVDSRIKIVKTPILEPYSFYKRFTGKKKGEKIYSGFINDKKSITQKLSIWIRGNFFIPDARKFWIKPSIRFINRLNDVEKFEFIISTGPPHSMHMIAKGVKKKNPSIKWIADFRDPWTNIDFYDQLKLSNYADKKHKRLEKEVLNEADGVVAIGWTMAKELSELAGGKEVEIITNGYDHVDFELDVETEKCFSITYFGSMNSDRNPSTLWEALKSIKINNPEIYSNISINLIGQIDGVVKQEIENKKLQNISISGFIPHKEVIVKMKSSQVLLLIINNTPNAKGILTGKAFEYLGAERPIICIGPEEGDMKRLFSEYKHVKYINYSDVDTCEKVILQLYNDYLLNKQKEIKVDTMKYSRAFLAKEYVSYINSF